MKVLAFVGQKGGTSKTTCAVSVASEMLARGERVLVIDADPQNSARTWIGLGVRLGHAMPTAASMGAEMAEPGQLDVLSGAYDTVVIDCPSRIDDKVGATMRSALMFAGGVGGIAVLPCGPSSMDVWALADTLETVKAAQGLRPDLKGYVLIAKKTKRTILGDSSRQVLDGCGLPVLSTELHHRMAYQEAPAAGLGVAQYTKGAAAAEIVALVDELVQIHQATSRGGHGQDKATTAA